MTPSFLKHFLYYWLQELRTNRIFQRTKANAILYSLVETAKTNMVNTFEYFNLLLAEIPQHIEDKDPRFLDDLLPWSPRVQKEYPSEYRKS